MRRTSIIAAVIGNSLLASTSFAAFSYGTGADDDSAVAITWHEGRAAAGQPGPAEASLDAGVGVANAPARPESIPAVINSITPNPVNVVFGPVVTDGAPFLTTVNATSPDAGVVLTLNVENTPGLTNVTVMPGANGDFLVTGSVHYSLNGTDVPVPFTVTNQTMGASIAGLFTLHVTPEPASLGLVSLLAVLRGRRRK